MRTAGASLAILAVLGIGLGTIGGNMAVSGMRPTAPAMPSYPVSDDALPAVQPVADAGDCVECSDYQDGYRWALQTDVTAPGGCAVDSWTFQRGCLAAIRDTRAS